MVSQSGLQSWDRLCNLTGEQIFVTDWLFSTGLQGSGVEAREPAASLDTELVLMAYLECGPRISSTSR